LKRARRVDMHGVIDLQTPVQGPVQGPDRASASLNQAATRIAAIGQPSGDSVDLSTEMVGLIQARNDFSANVTVAQTSDEVTQSLLDIVG
jgi:flagellar basal body rod protein FlgG